MQLYDTLPQHGLCRVRNTRITVTQDDIDRATETRYKNLRRLVPTDDYCSCCVVAEAINRTTGLDEASVGNDTISVAGWNAKDDSPTYTKLPMTAAVQAKIQAWDHGVAIAPFAFTITGFNLLFRTAEAEALLGTKRRGKAPA